MDHISISGTGPSSVNQRLTLTNYLKNSRIYVLNPQKLSSAKSKRLTRDAQINPKHVEANICYKIQKWQLGKNTENFMLFKRYE